MIITMLEVTDRKRERNPTDQPNGGPAKEISLRLATNRML